MVFWHTSNIFPPWFHRVKLVVIPPRFVQQQYLWNIAIQSAVGCYNSWANLRKNKLRSDRENEPIVDVTAAEKEAIQSKWVVNVSDRVLSPDETSLLKKGLNFAIAPKTVDEYVIGIESACRHIGPESQQAAKLRADCVRLLQHAKPPTSNITNAERKALTALAKDANITILPADKGRAVVVMNTSDYKEKAKNILSDNNTYKVLKKDPTSKYKTQLSSKLQEIRQLNEISDVEHRRLLPTSTLTPRFYGLPKVHKAGAPLRPIVASRGSITYGVARHVADILSPLVGKNGYALNNSEDMVNSLNNCTLQEDDILVSFDVTALFTKVPVDKSVEIIHDRLTRDTSLPSRTRMTANHVRDLLLTCLKTTYFLYDGVIYSQVEGAAMGSPGQPHSSEPLHGVVWRKRHQHLHVRDLSVEEICGRHDRGLGWRAPRRLHQPHQRHPSFHQVHPRRGGGQHHPHAGC